MEVDVAESFCLFEVEAEPAGSLDFAPLSKSSMDLCLTFLTSWLLLLPLRLVGLWILTGEPLMLTKTFVLLMDLFMGAFGPVGPGGLVEGRLLGFVLTFRAERTGRELGVLACDEGGNSVLGEEATPEGDTLFTCDPPSTNPLPLNGMMFRMSCDPETGR